jgi:2-phospho-L-lactate guanylyltransferase
MIVTREPDLAGALGINDPRLSLGLQLADAMGLNAAIDIGRAVAVERAVTRLVVLSADLPTLMTSDMQDLDTEWTDVVLAPDRAGTGTNALVLRGDRAIRSFGARFGIGSCAMHVAEAERHGLTWSDIAIPGIAYDLDTPEDWQGLPGHLRQALLQEGHARIAGRHATRSTSIPHVMEHA